MKLQKCRPVGENLQDTLPSIRGKEYPENINEVVYWTGISVRVLFGTPNDEWFVGYVQVTISDGQVSQNWYTLDGHRIFNATHWAYLPNIQNEG